MTATDDFWKRQIDFDINWAKKRLLEAGGVASMFVVYGHDSVMPMPAALRDDDAQELTYRLVEALCLVHRARAYAFMVEAWASAVEGPRETLTERIERMPAPSSDPKRVEVVMCGLVYRDDAGKVAILQRTGDIVRNAKGEPTDLRVRGPAAISLPAASVGRIYELLRDADDEPTDDELKAAFKFIMANSKEMKPN